MRNVCGTQVGKTQEDMEKRSDGIAVGQSHENRVGGDRTHDLTEHEINNTRNMRWLGMMHMDCVKEEAANEEQS